MELKPGCYEKVIQLIDKGVDIPNPLTLDIGDEVNIDLISGSDVLIYPGCRIYGEKTVICSGARIGYEAPVTIDNCRVGRNVELKGGYFSQSVFLEKSSMGLGAHVREGCILEEESSGAHCVGLKQTILFPFVTLGSLINFCDCLMAGGTSRKNHSEVGSSYIHFNFTPDGDKATASLIGDVPRGVMLNQPPIFLGGQGGMIGPLRLGYGNIVAAGTILRNDVIQDNKLIFGKSLRGAVIDNTHGKYPALSRIVENNILYMANLLALEQWYMHVRQPFFMEQEFGGLLYRGALDTLMLAKKERMKRLEMLAGNVRISVGEKPDAHRDAAGKQEFTDSIGRLKEIFLEGTYLPDGEEFRTLFLGDIDTYGKGGGYIACIQGLPAEASQNGVRWLETIVGAVCKKAGSAVPSMGLFKE